jgi:hypothetical protein
MRDDKKKQIKKTTPPKGEEVFTKEDFLRDLRKVIQRLPKASLVKRKRKTSE